MAHDNWNHYKPQEQIFFIMFIFKLIPAKGYQCMLLQSWTYNEDRRSEET